jgi:hypothetical protein
LSAKVIAMSTTEVALENLRIIRSLMEKAHIYRAVSAPAALTGGLLALAASAWPLHVSWHLSRPLDRHSARRLVPERPAARH